MIADLIRQAAAQLREAGIETPEHDAKLLLAEAVDAELRDIDKAMLMGEGLDSLAPAGGGCRAATGGGQADPVTNILAAFHAMLSRRAKREPLQYITGHTPFRYLDLQVGPGVLVDLCAGSGAIGLSIVSEVPGSQVWAVELSPRTAEWTRRNLAVTAKRYPSIASNYQLEVADATSLATLAQLDGTIDIVITNPPYVPQTDIPEQPEVRDWDPELALYGGSADGTLIPERIIERAWRLLKPGGVLVMEHDLTQGERLVAYAKATGFATASTGKDWTGRDRYLFAEK